MRPQAYSPIILYHVFYDIPTFGIRIHFKCKKVFRKSLYELFTFVLSADIGY